MEKDLHSNCKVFEVIGPTDGAAAGASTVGNIIDTNGFESFEYAIMAGTITTGTFSLTLEEGDDSGLSDAAAVPTANLIGANKPVWADTDSDTICRVGLNAKKRYQRLTLAGAATPVADFAAIAVLSDPKSAPVADQDNA